MILTASRNTIKHSINYNIYYVLLISQNFLAFIRDLFYEIYNNMFLKNIYIYTNVGPLAVVPPMVVNHWWQRVM